MNACLEIPILGKILPASKTSIWCCALIFSKLVLADNLQGLEKNFNDLLCPVLKGFVMGKARYPRYFEDFQFSDEKDASKMLSEIVSRGADEKVTTGDSFLRTFFKVIKGGIGEGAIRTCFCTGWTI